ncbi:hypothetical protein KTR66_04880 [Roseococcus sp. SDR]|uniref:hypothetical protein n=1 Tax=Roseococcus sp. SDR TaxID=2835532 RepID=UPI001BCE4C99|nr:hypothetical protein [Roseococcus sp. SDR]MBS7789314.1 hypothetical protein [Roseococcus sp. SDR]MBV1844628.1 hypothetical protein [Roseococcus sp. SDR]
MILDLNHQSGLVYGRAAHGMADTTARINAHVDAALVARNQRQRPRDYLGGSRIGEACARKLVYEVAHSPKDAGRDFDGGILRVFDAGHQFETLSIRWLRQAGFDLRDRGADGEQFGFAAADGKLRGHADGVIVAGPDVGIRWPSLWEHKALGQKSWNDLVKHGLRQSKPIYFAQVQLYMAYLEIEVALLTALNRDTLALHHEAVPFDAAEAQRLSDRAVDILRAAEAGELPPRIAAHADFFLCRFCPYAARCWEANP